VRLILSFVLLVAMTLTFASPAGANGSPPIDPPAPSTAGGGTAIVEGPVDAEDLIEISVFEVPDLARTVRVSQNGTISLPLLGEIEVRGLTPMQLESRLRDELTKRFLQDPQVSVFIREHGSKKVSILGAVGKPGVYEMLGPRTVLQVLSEAGGLTPDVGRDLFVIRGSEGQTAEITINVADLMIAHDASLNVPIRPGDVINVPPDRKVYVYVDGAVRSPGRLEELASRPITLLQAVAKAGGTTERANPKKVQILRRGESNTQIVLGANLSRIRRGQEADRLLEEGDVVVVPEAFF
jgi:polysaccharide export outer membrane protein